MLNQSPNPLTLKKIILVKQIYQRAIINSKSSSIADKIIAIILFDLSNETMLHTVLTSIDSTKKPPDDFPPLLNRVDEVLSKNNFDSLPDRVNILRVHTIRNKAQHEAIDPSDTELSDCSTYTRDFLKKITKEIWSLDFEEISLTELINHSEIKQYLIDAEDFFENKDFKKSAEKASAGFELSLRFVSATIVGRQPLFNNYIVTTDAFGREHKGSREYAESIERMRDTLSFLALNLNYMDYMKFKKITGNPIWTLGGEQPHDFYNQKENITEDDAKYCLAFAINGIISIENTVGDLEKPFGQDQF